ncbi:hypothetical protein [Sphaerisporangium sp. NPDC051011]
MKLPVPHDVKLSGKPLTPALGFSINSPPTLIGSPIAKVPTPARLT